MFIRVCGGRKKSEKFVSTKGTISVTTNITGASITVMDGATPVASGSTMSGYTYTTEKIKYGTYVVTITKEGYKDFTQTVILNADDAKVNAQLESVNEVKAELDKAHKVTDTTVQVDFTNKIAVPTKDNFSIEGLTIEDVKLTDDQKSVILTVKGMELDKTYTVKTNNIIDANGKAVNNGAVDFVARKISYKVDMKIVDVNTGKDITQIKSDGNETAKFVVTLYDDAGEVVKDSKAEIRFTTTAGNFAETKVTAQSGVASNIFTSEISATKKDALVTATVVAADNKDLINLEAKRTLSMSPVIDTDDSAATLTDVMVETCDRVILYFNKDVKATDYTINKSGKTYKYNPDKMKIEIADNAGTYETVEQCRENNKKVYEPIALAPVPGETKALYAILDSDNDAENKNAEYLTDNAKTIVKVTDNTKAVPATETKATTVTDINDPSILDVVPDGLRSIKVTFSEPVQNNANRINEDASYSAELAKKWSIDGIKLSDNKWGSSIKATAKVGKFDIDTAVDTRNVVTITLGKDVYGNQIYFPAGSHSVQGDKIGDWANATDTENNINNTQTLDFVVKTDDTAPTATVTVQSPEQFDLKFNTPVSKTDLESSLELQQKVENEWVELKGDKSLRSIRSVDADGKEYIVELTDDWTNILDTYTTKKNYHNFNFRLYLKKGVVKNETNGLYNEEIALDLNEKIMKTADVTSAELSGVYKDDNTVVIDISEPVQINVKDDKGNYTRKLTPTSEQKKDGTLLSDPIVQFISEGETETIQGKIIKINDYDNQITVEPEKTITTGKWKVVVRNVSDDVGNTSPTLVKNDFIVDKPIVNDDFKVLWVVAVKAGKSCIIPGTNNTGKFGENDNDVIYVKFNKEIKTTGGTLNAGATTNYTVNGYTLPTTTKIVKSVGDYSDDSVTANGYSDIVAITLPEKKLTESSNSINISKTLESATGDKLGNGGSKLLTKLAEGVFTWNYEVCDANVIGKTSVTTSEIQEFLNDGKYSRYDLSGVTITDAGKETLTLKHSAPVTFKDGTHFKELDIKTSETGKLEIKSETVGKMSADTVIVNAPNADVILDGVTVDTDGIGALKDGKLIVEDILNGTLTLKGGTVVNNLTVKDSNTGAIRLEGINTKIDNTFVIDTSGEITLEVGIDFAVTTGLPTAGVEVKKACTIHVKDERITGDKIKFELAKSINLDNMKITEDKNASVEVFVEGDNAEKTGVVKPETAKGVTLSYVSSTKGSTENTNHKAAQTTVKITKGVTKDGKLRVVVGDVVNKGGVLDVDVTTTDNTAAKVASAIVTKYGTVSSAFNGYTVIVDPADESGETLLFKSNVEAADSKFPVTINVSDTGVKYDTPVQADGIPKGTNAQGTYTLNVDELAKNGTTNGTEVKYVATNIAGTLTLTITNIAADGTQSKVDVTVPITAYMTGADVATAIENAVAEDGGLSNGVTATAVSGKNRNSAVKFTAKGNGDNVTVTGSFEASK